MNTNFSVRTGILSGTLLSLAPQVSSVDVIKTVILAAVGATASFLVTVFLKWVCGKKK